MHEASFCNGLVASPCGVAGRASGAAAALAESVLVMGGYSTKSSFPAGRMVVADNNKARPLSRTPKAAPAVQMNLMVCKSMRWWEKGVQPNMREIQSAQDLADSLLTAGDTLVVLDFFTPGCGACRTLHPKISQLAEKNPDVLFLQVNHDRHKSMCYSLQVHVLPLFRFYRGAEARVASFSCTNATINKFKDALAKHGTDRCSLAPARGLDHSDLMALAQNQDLHFTFTYDKEPGTTATVESKTAEA